MNQASLLAHDTMITSALRTAASHIVRGPIRLATRRCLPADFHRRELPLKALRASLAPDQANATIAALLESGKPFLVARLGAVELAVVKKYRKMKTLTAVEKLADFGITGDWSYCWTRRCTGPLETNAGFFPITHETLDRFAATMIDAMGGVDLLASWLPGEGYFEAELAGAQLCNLADIEPYYHRNPWSRFLAGRHVLVIHPFAVSILQQYNLHRHDLFKDPLVLPEFQLSTLRAVQSIAGNRPQGHVDWFSALQSMFDAAVATQADVVILGCGAYGFPLGAMLKAAGKQVIHLAGSTQILFGIKGKRWERHRRIADMFNEHWVRPAPEERPAGAERVEGACYW
jgi:hypothetical protein